MIQKHVFKTIEKGYGQREVRPVWNHAMRVNHQNFSNSRRNFAPTAVLTKFGIVPISNARQCSSRVAAPVSTVRPINTIAPKPIVNVAKSRRNAFQKRHSLSRRPFHQQTSLKNRYLVNTAKVKSVNTAKGKSVKSVVGKQGSNAVKSLACWAWRPKIKVQYHVSKDHTFGDPQAALRDTRLFDSGCSRHMTGNKSFLSNYQAYDGGFVAFAGSFKRAKEDETCGILKDFITGIENLLNHKVKIIRCDNRIEFKNYEMNQLCGIKGIKREFSNTRTPQENIVAERKYKTLIEAARTMLADSLLPIPFWAEAVNTACYVQNRVLVTKPHNKTPYELLIGRSPIISFMRPFGCPVTILNTLNHLEKFNGKVDEGFLVGYYINSKAFRVYISRTKKVEENLHVNFLENKPNISGCGPEWLFDIDSLTNSMNYQPVSAGNRTNGIAGSKIHSDVGQEVKEKVSDQEYILLLVLNTSSYVPSSNEKVESSPKDDAGKKSIVEPTCVEGGKIDDLGCLDQQIKSTYDSENTNSTNSFNTTSPTVNRASDKDGTFQRTYGEWNFLKPILVNDVGSSFSHPTALDDFSKMPNLEDTGIFDGAYDDRDEGAEADYNNLEIVISICPIPSTRIHKDHPKEQIIREALDDEIWVEAMQKELLQFKLLNVWTLVDLPYRKRAIGTKWVYRNKRKQRGIVVRYKAMLVAQVHIKEEGIDYNEVFAPVARIEAIRLDIMFAVCACSRFQVQPKVSHMHEVKRIFIYLKGHPTLGLWYPKDSHLELIAYSDSNYVEAEYIAASSCCGKVLWLQNQLLDYGYNFMQTKIHVDNESTIRVVKNPVYHSKIKHIEIRHHFIRDSYEKRYDLTISPTIYASYIEQFWNTASFKTVNYVKQIHAIVDGRVVVISESLVRNDLLFDDEDDEAVNQEEGDRVERAITTNASLEAAQDGDNITKTQTTTMPNLDISQGIDTSGRPRCQEIMGGTSTQTRVTQLETEPSTTKAIYNKSFITLTNKERIIEEMDKDENINLVSEQGEVQETAEHLRDDDDETLTETLLYIKRSSSKDNGKGIMQETELPKKNRPFSKAEVKKNMIMYLKNQGGYKQSYFKEIKYEDIRPLFERIWDQVYTFKPKDSKIERKVMKRAGFDLQQGSSKKQSDKIELGSTTTTLTAKLYILNLAKYDLWLMRREQNFLMTNYSFWEVIKNGNKVLKRTVGIVEQIYEPTSVEEKLDRKNEIKARGTLYQLKFYSYQDAKLVMEAIEKRYEGNKESKKVQRTLFKQQYKNFAASSSENLDQTFDRLQKLISQLEIQGEVIEQEDMNLKLLRSLPFEWKTRALI
uniref:Integrase catalytic domain-containing protein n=1 Tax=Tanacetum cinerariifolium TaxID=118510 RepID=A0A6L2JC70_TANCI|nr:hypothetical protein [Tanacetum cinerariifolium]